MLTPLIRAFDFCSPYQLAGRLAIYAGLVLFVMAGVLMYRSKPAPRQDADELE